MIAECRNYLTNLIVSSGIKTAIKTTMKDLKASNESHIGAILFESDEFEKSGQKKSYNDLNGTKQKRTKKFKRTTAFTVVIGEYTQSKCETIFNKFMENIEGGMYIDGNYVYIEPGKADWVEEKDSILKAKVAVQIEVKFEGGIYKDTSFNKVQDVKVDSEIGRG